MERQQRVAVELARPEMERAIGRVKRDYDLTIRELMLLLTEYMLKENVVEWKNKPNA